MTTARNYPRICLLTNSFYPRIGGGEAHALLLCKEWMKRDVPVFVLTRRVTPDLPKMEQLDGLTIRRLPPSGVPRFGKYLMIAPAFFELRKRRNEYDVIYVCGLRVTGIPAVMASRQLGKTCVLRAESRGELSGDFIWQSPDEAIRKTRFKPLIRLYLRWRNRLLLKAPAFVSISRDIQSEYLQQGVPAPRAHLIPNGIETSRFEAADADLRQRRRQELGLPNRTTFVYSGKLNKGKGLEMLLRTWKSLSDERKDCHLVLVGGGGGQFLSCEIELRAFVLLKSLQDRVTFTGFQTDVHKYLQAADFFVFPSENEALSIALLEALSCELPCLASDISGNRDIVEDRRNGRLLPVNDETAWLNGMREFLGNPAQAIPLGKQGRATVLEQFSIARVAEQHLDLFRSLTSPSGGKAS